jgi:hypothetical protein
VSSRPEARVVKESKQTYCDATAGVNLIFVSELDGVKFYASRNVEDVGALLDENREALGRFNTKVLHPLGDLFNLDQRR